MGSEPANLRYERKFLPDGLSRAEVLACIRMHSALFREAYPERTVNNLYLDTPNRRHYFDHINGAACREKVRVRWYGAFQGRVERPRLEFKYRRGLLGGKTTHALPAFTVNGGFRRAELAALWQDLPEAIRLRLGGVEPSLANRYRRSYFVSADGHFRLTLDWALETWDVCTTARPAHPAMPEGLPFILELKYDALHAPEADRITNAFPFRLVRCSKYVLGVERLES
jgi:hypothetical protein